MGLLATATVVRVARLGNTAKDPGPLLLLSLLCRLPIRDFHVGDKKKKGFSRPSIPSIQHNVMRNKEEREHKVINRKGRNSIVAVITIAVVRPSLRMAGTHLMTSSSGSSK